MDISQRIKFSQLFGIYKGLLTTNQQKIFALYNENDVGYSEIALEFDITRQGVREIIIKTMSKLEEFETKLKILDSYYSISKELKEISLLCSKNGVNDDIISKIDKVVLKLEE